MKVSVKSRYALYIMLDLAERYNSSVSVRDAATRQGIPIKYAEKLIGILKRAGLVTVTRGSTGGYRLARDPDRIRVLEIFRLMETGEEPCADDCARRAACYARVVWQRLDQAQEQALGISLSDVLQSGNA